MNFTCNRRQLFFMTGVTLTLRNEATNNPLPDIKYPGKQGQIFERDLLTSLIELPFFNLKLTERRHSRRGKQVFGRLYQPVMLHMNGFHKSNGHGKVRISLQGVALGDKFYQLSRLLINSRTDEWLISFEAWLQTESAFSGLFGKHLCNQINQQSILNSIQIDKSHLHFFKSHSPTTSSSRSLSISQLSASLLLQTQQRKKKIQQGKSYLQFMTNKARQKLSHLLESCEHKYTAEYLKNADFELGIDEAGRGPVFGSMIYSALWWPVELKEELASLGFNDSKALNEEQRESLLTIIDALRGKLVFYQIKELTAQYISTSMNNNKNHINLNEISHRSALELTRGALKEGFKIVHVYADTVGDPGKYAEFLRKGLPEYASIVKNITVQPKADRDHKVVSAASICAKVNRDHILQTWKFRENIEFKGSLGSGYPSDPTTKEWLQNNKDAVFGYPNLIRFSWNTTTNALEGQLKLKIHEELDQKPLIGYQIFKEANLHRDILELVKE